jgi:hypothetical protein
MSMISCIASSRIGSASSADKPPVKNGVGSVNHPARKYQRWFPIPVYHKTTKPG